MDKATVPSMAALSRGLCTLWNEIDAKLSVPSKKGQWDYNDGVELVNYGLGAWVMG